MNTVRSVGYGWGVLIAAGGGAYFFAKRSINADRAERAEAEERRRQANQRLQYGVRQPPAPSSATGDGHASPGKEAQEHISPASGHHAAPEENRFESSKPFVSKKGDRFS
ncbi:hypothetical protein MBLNU459_g3173t1 [Dothideomycetes sp. NU459]